MFIAGMMLAGSLTVNAQTAEQRKQITKNYDHELIAKQAKEFADQAKKDKEAALAMAEIKGWPVKFETKDGNFAELVGLYPDGSPLYYQTLNANAAFTSGINTLNTGGSLGLNVDGQDMLIGIWDQDRPRNEHNTFGGRLDIIDAALNIASHPTHVMGTMIGSGVGSTDLKAKGMASEANGIAYDWNSDTSEMQSEAGAGLLVSNHSYGSIASQVSQNPWLWGAYSSQARAYDQVAFAAKGYLIVQAAGNDRGEGFNAEKGGYDLINGTKTAKNAVTVAAVNGLSSAYNNPGQVIMSGFSSWGPTDDNRVKPDISAKGVSVYSSITSGTSNSTYGNSNGTSMASPVVAGGALLLQQLYAQENAGEFMRSATLRGLICHTADEAGPADGPDPMFGWGLFDAKKAAQAILDNGEGSIIDERSLANNTTQTININAVGSGPLQVSITWTDPAGSATNGTVDSTNPKLVNNLDVKVTQGDNTYYPWKLADVHTSPAERGENDVDNIERVDIENPSGQYTITISHKNSLTQTQGSQEFSLIVTGAQLVLGLDEGAVNLFSVWPNPANTEVNIDLIEGLSDDASVVFYDVQGREVLTQNLTQNQTSVNTQTLSAGIYMVKVTQAGKQQVKKVVINR